MKKNKKKKKHKMSSPEKKKKRKTKEKREEKKRERREEEKEGVGEEGGQKTPRNLLSFPFLSFPFLSLSQLFQILLILVSICSSNQIISLFVFFGFFTALFSSSSLPPLFFPLSLLQYDWAQKEEKEKKRKGEEKKEPIIHIYI